MEQVRFRLRICLVILSCVMVFGTAGFMTAEDLSFEDALYFTIVTVATVGYGDIHPVTPLGKAMGILLIITGVGAFLGLIANATELMLNRREKTARMKKLNVIAGLFFSEIGTSLLRYFSSLDPQCSQLSRELLVSGTWTDKEFSNVAKKLLRYEYRVRVCDDTIETLRSFFEKKHGILLRMMEHPSLDEHELLTDMVMAVCHLREEIQARESLSDLPGPDIDHLAGDIQRAYRLLVLQWLGYMLHLKEHYPYLFSLAVRTNPFNRDASPLVTA